MNLPKFLISFVFPIPYNGDTVSHPENAWISRILSKIFLLMWLRTNLASTIFGLLFFLKMKKIVGVKPAYQMHVTCSKSQISKNLRDGKVLDDYVRMKGVFSKDTNSVPLMNIATGVVAPKNVNVHQAKQIGCSYLATLHGTKPNETKLSKSSQCTQIPLKLKNVHDVDKASSLDPQLLFQRILALTEVSSDVDLKTCLGFELACYPAALFSEDGYIRDANKSNLAKEILSMTNHPDYVDISSEHHIVKD